MCYDSYALTKRSVDYAKRVGYSPETIEELEQQFLRIRETQGPIFHASGYSHPRLPVIHQDQENWVEMSFWGLIPFWTKDRTQALSIRNKTINARSESLLEKPAFRKAGRYGRCLVVVDGFFEHHHKGGKTFPYKVEHQSEQPMVIAGVSDDWTDPQSGEIWRSFAIVTTKAEGLMAEIHNNPKLPEPRTPLILNEDTQKAWLSDWGAHQKRTLAEIRAEAVQTGLEATPVRRLRGKEAVGNLPLALEPYSYPELEGENPSNDTGQMELF